MGTLARRLRDLERRQLQSPDTTPTFEIWMHFDDATVEHVNTGERMPAAEVARRYPDVFTIDIARAEPQEGEPRP